MAPEKKPEAERNGYWPEYEPLFKRLERLAPMAGAPSRMEALLLAHRARDEERLVVLEKVVAIGEKIGGAAGQAYVRAVLATGDFAALTKDAIPEFAQKIGQEAACDWLWAIVTTGAVDVLTSDTVLGSPELVRRIPAGATAMLFWAIGETGAADKLLREDVAGLAESFGAAFANAHFAAIGRTKEAGKLTEDSVIRFARALGLNAARVHFEVISATGKVDELTDYRVLGSYKFMLAMGSAAAREYLWVLAETDKIGRERLTSKEVCSSRSTIRKLKNLEPEQYPKFFEHIAKTGKVQDVEEYS